MHVEDNDPPAGDGPTPEGDGGGTGNGGSNPPQSVPYETHRKLLDEKKKAEQKARELEQEKLERQRKELEEKGEFEKLLKLERETRAKAEAELEASRNQEKARRKLGAVLESVGGEIDRKFFNLIDYDEVVIDPTTGELDRTSVAAVVEKLKREYPEIIKAKQTPNLPNTAPAGGQAKPKSIKRSEWEKLPSAEMKKWKFEEIVDG